MNTDKLLESLSPNERKVLPNLEEKEFNNICKKSNLDKISVMRALEFLDNKKIIELAYEDKKIAELGVNGALYKRKGLPERRLLNFLDKKRMTSLANAQNEAALSNDEFRVALGALKKKAMIEINNNKLVLSADKEEVSKKMLEEQLLEFLPLDISTMSPEQLHALKSLQGRKEIVELKNEKSVIIKITLLGRDVLKKSTNFKDLIEQITPELLKKESNWKGKKFRRYDVHSPLPQVNGGKRHFVNQASDYARKVWTEMGFREMTGNLVQTSFWNFDALFTAQDHPVREMQDTFFLNKKGNLPAKELIHSVKKAHEEGVDNSKGWRYKWDEEEAKRLVLRTHTTCLSSQTLASLDLADLPAKFFSVGKVFRNETIDWKHGIEFNQTEGIVVDPEANFRHLLGYLAEFLKKMGFTKFRFRPAYFPYTEPSVEADVWNEERQEWVEILGAGIFRPEVTVPLLGKPIPVLAWGPGFDRMILDMFKIKDMRDLYKNNLNQLRRTKVLVK